MVFVNSKRYRESVRAVFLILKKSGIYSAAINKGLFKIRDRNLCKKRVHVYSSWLDTLIKKQKPHLPGAFIGLPVACNLRNPSASTMVC